MRYKKALSWCVAFAVFFSVHRVPCYGGERWKPILDVAVRDDQVYVATVEKGAKEQ